MITVLIFFSSGEEHRGLPGKTCSSEEAEGKVGILYYDDLFMFFWGGEVSTFLCQISAYFV